jgi:hypothetical protein
MEVGHDCEWIDIIGQVFRVLDFDRAGTIIQGNKVKAKTITKPYGYLLVESPVLNQPVRLPIVHRDDFLLAASVFDEPRWLEVLDKKEYELLTTYVPKLKLPRGMAGITHALHYVLTPYGTLDSYYGQDFISIHMANPVPEKLFGMLAWDGLLRVQVNLNPKI